MPPVGQNRTCPKTAASDLSAGRPPDAVAGKNLKRVSPMSRPRMMSPALAVPGRKGMPLLIAALPSGSVRPGLTMNFAPAAILASRSVGLSTVPAPMMAPSTLAISAITSSAAGVRRVTSRTVRPPRTRASAIGRAYATSSTTSTGMTGAARMMSSIVMWCVPWQRPPPHRTSRVGDA